MRRVLVVLGVHKNLCAYTCVGRMLLFCWSSYASRSSRSSLSPTLATRIDVATVFDLGDICASLPGLTASVLSPAQVLKWHVRTRHAFELPPHTPLSMMKFFRDRFALHLCFVLRASCP
jgi:hypothetical protein